MLIFESTRATLLVVIVVLEALSEDSAEEPSAGHVVSVDNAATSELDALASVVNPGKVDVQGSLDNAENDGDGVGLLAGDLEFTDEPVDTVEGAVGTESDEVEGVDNGWDGCLSKEEKLRKNANGLENLGEYPHPLQVVSNVQAVRER